MASICYTIRVLCIDKARAILLHQFACNFEPIRKEGEQLENYTKYKLKAES